MTSLARHRKASHSGILVRPSGVVDAPSSIGPAQAVGYVALVAVPVAMVWWLTR